jgi:acyl transferase domain-containing protein/NADPH:quinone reductase-like Zn-dependent oxidoreductase
LECAYEALENAGIPKESVSGKKVGVFVGGNYGEHRVGNLRDLDNIPGFDATGNQGAFLAGRLAYYFNLRGPAFTIDTACSSSMHALHLAVQSIRAGESEQAIVGASHLITHPDIWVSMSKLQLFSDAGKTYAFDHRAKSGYARGEGAGCLILKPLAQAFADNDHIFSVITHTGVSHNGRTVGIVAPSQDEQESLLKKVFSEAEINPTDVGFFEAHGTGTKKGDPIEAHAIYKAVGSHFTNKDPLLIGSSKPNVGHLECASGIVSVIKGVLMLYYGFILPNADFQRANEAIPMQNWNMSVATGQKPWPAKRKYVCVNNFGFSGSNSTCILSAAPQIRSLEVGESVNYSPLRLFVVSANDEVALRSSVKKLGIWIEQHAELYQTTMPRNLSYTLCQRRSHLPWRVAVVAGMCGDVATALNSPNAVSARASSETPRLGFVYTGQGAQWYAMGRELLRTHPVFYEAVVRADTALRAIDADFSVLEELQQDKASSRVGHAHISQPICTAVQLALTDLFDSFGIKPAAVTGHSSGEIGAAYAAGALTFESAMAAAYYRGQAIVELKQAHPGLRGSMMAVGAGAEQVAPILDALSSKGGPQAVVACENSPSSTTLSGDEEAIDQLCAVFQEKGVFNRKLFVDVAYHSPHMKLIAEVYLAKIQHIQPPAGMAASKVEFFSSLRGRKIKLAELGPQYWVDNLTHAVRFSTSLQRVCTESCPDFLVEIGPHAALKGPIMQTLARLGAAAAKITYLPTLVRGEDATRVCLETAGQLFVHGYPLDFFQINHHREEAEKPELVPALYTYPWSKQKYWYESRVSKQHRLKPFGRNDLLGTLADWSNDLEPTWRNVLRLEDLPWLKEFQIQSRTVFPVAGFVSMVLEAATQSSLAGWIVSELIEIKNLVVSEHLFMAEGRDIEVILTFRPFKTAGRKCHEFRICSYEVSRGWLAHCTGTVDSTTDPYIFPESSETSSEMYSSWDDEDDEDYSYWSEDDPYSEVMSSPYDACSDVTDFTEYTVVEDGTAPAQPPAPPVPPSAGGVVQPTFRCLAGSGEAVYGRLGSQGMSYPASFQSLLGVSAKGGEAMAQCAVRDTAANMPLGHETSYTIHPAIIDTMFQVPLLIRGADGKEEGQKPQLPSSIRRIILKAPWKQGTGQSFCVNATPETRTDSFMVELSAPPRYVRGILCMSGLEFKALQPAPLSVPAPRELSFKIEWKPLGEPESTRTEINKPTAAGAGIVVVTESKQGAKHPLVAALCGEIEEQVGVSPQVCKFEAIDSWNAFFIVLSELEHSLLDDVDEQRLEQVKKLLTEARGVMWVTMGATMVPITPKTNMALGLIRTARSERGAVAATLDLCPRSTLIASGKAALILKAFILSVLGDNEEAEMEFAESGGKLVVPRIVPDDVVNEEVHRSLGPSAPYQQNFYQPGRRLQLASKTHASLPPHGLYFEDAPNEPLAANEVEIAVTATAISQDDVTASQGQKVAAPLARSCTGTVTRVGNNVETVRVGDRVCALAEGPIGTHARTKATSIAAISDSVGINIAACIAGPYLAAYFALTSTAKVQPGERVLVQFSGPAGVAAFEVAKQLGAISYVLVSSLQQREVAIKAGVPFEQCLDARNIHLCQDIEQATEGKGMDVVLALSSSGNQPATSWSFLADFGRFVEIMTPGRPQNTTAELVGSGTCSSADIAHIATARPLAMQRALAALVDTIETGLMAPLTPMSVVSMEELNAGIRLVREGAVQSIVVAAEEQDQVKVSDLSAQSRRRCECW